MIKRTLYLLACLGFVQTVNVANGKEFKWEDGPHIGVAGAGDTSGESFAWGWQAQYNHNEYWSWELAVTTHDDEINTALNQAAGITGDVDLDLNIYKAYLTGRVNLLGYDFFTLYLGLGFGYSIFDEEGNESLNANLGNIVNSNFNLRNEFSYHGALGFEFILDRRWEIFTEFHYAVLETKMDVNVAQDIGAFITDSKFSQDFDYDYILYRLGLNYRF